MDYEHPRLAAIYDLDNPWDRDNEFYVALAGKVPCRVLDLGCGTGTLCCALAKHGHQVTGVDPSPAMLSIAARKPYGPQVEWIESEAQRYQTNRRFDLILMTGHVFQIFLTDADALAVLATIRRHLAERGLAAFETRNPGVDWAGAWTAEPPVIHTVSGRRVRRWLEIGEQQSEFISFTEYFEFSDERLRRTSTLRFPSRSYVKELISRAGLAVRETFGDWDRSPYEADRSPEMIFVTERAQARTGVELQRC